MTMPRGRPPWEEDEKICARVYATDALQAQGLTRDEIAHVLNVSYGTVVLDNDRVGTLRQAVGGKAMAELRQAASSEAYKVLDDASARVCAEATKCSEREDWPAFEDAKAIAVKVLKAQQLLISEKTTGMVASLEQRLEETTVEAVRELAGDEMAEVARATVRKMLVGGDKIKLQRATEAAEKAIARLARLARAHPAAVHVEQLESLDSSVMELDEALRPRRNGNGS